MKSEIEKIFERHQIDSYSEEWDASNLDKKMIDEDAIIHWVSRYGTTEDLAYLIKAGANLNLKGDIGRTPIMEAVNFNQLENTKLLINYGADLTLKDDYGDSIYTLVSSDNKQMLAVIGQA